MQRCRQPLPAKSQWNIPLSLLDLTFAHARQHHGHESTVLLRRYAHALALKSRPADVAPAPELFRQPSPAYRQTRVGSSRPRLSHFREAENRPALAGVLEQKVDALIGYRQEEQSLQEVDEEETNEEIHYSEAELQSLYTDILAHDVPMGEVSKRVEEMETFDPYTVLDEVAERLLAKPATDVDGIPIPSSDLISRLKPETESRSSEHVREQEVLDQFLHGNETHRKIISRLLSFSENLERASNVSKVVSVVPVSILNDQEWRALVQVTVEKGDLQLAELTLSLCMKSGSGALEDALDVVLTEYAKSGQPESVALLLEKLHIDQPSATQRDRHIKAHLLSSSSVEVSDTALESTLATIHDYESRDLAPPMKSYSRTISALLTKKSTQFQAQAWDLFAHMRYVAHPTPDVFIYSQMIRACAGIGPSQMSSNAEPERALDLWTEMVNDAKIEPTDFAYNSIILACARSKKYATEAFRFAREMLDSHRDAFGNPSMRPDRRTFIALLVAAKTLKDLGRTRWLLAEILKMYEQELKEGLADGKRLSVAPDTTILMHVFNTYASYIPPFKRSDTRIVEELEGGEKASSKEIVPTETETGTNNPDEPGAIAAHSASKPFGVTPPQTRSEIFQEVDILLERIFEDSRNQESEGGRPSPFAQVGLNPTVLNAYLCVYLRHAPLDTARRVLYDTFKRAGIEPNAKLWMHVLERCAFAEKGDDRKMAKLFALEAWEKWESLTNTLPINNETSRMIERAHVAMIRHHALVNDLDRAMTLVRAFVSRFPPTQVASSPPTTPAMRSSRTLLFANRPIIRLTTPTEVPDDSVPPVLTFPDLESLHGRLAAKGWLRQNDIGFLKYVAKAYEGNMRKRRQKYLER